MLAKEIIVESSTSVFNRLLSPYRSKYKYVIGNNDSWAIDQSLVPFAVFTDDFIKKVLSLDIKLQHKTLFDPFYGFFPHEYNEAKVTVALCKGKVDMVLAKYPKYKMHSKIYQRLKQTNLSDKEIYNSFNIDADNKITPYTYIGGEAHEIIISDNPNGYMRFFDELHNKY